METIYERESLADTGSLDEPSLPFPKQHQEKPGIEAKLKPQPHYEAKNYRPAEKLRGKKALITGGDSGIGRAVALIYAREGADIVINFLPEEQEDAKETQRLVEETGKKCILIPGDLRDSKFCKELIEKTVKQLGRLDILVSNAAYQNRKSIEDLPDEELEQTFETNVYAYMRLAREAVKHFSRGGVIIATSSVTGLLGRKDLPAYSATKGAINAFTKALAQSLVKKGIRVNAVAPGPVWTPLNPADEGLTPDEVAHFGEDNPMGRPAQPEEIAPAYVFLASEADSSYITGTIVQIMGGETVGG